MGMFAMRKPRGFHHSYIYVDERKEKLAKMEEDAKRELGMLPEKEFSPEDIRGKFIEGTTHLKRRKDADHIIKEAVSPYPYGDHIITVFFYINTVYSTHSI